MASEIVGRVVTDVNNSDLKLHPDRIGVEPIQKDVIHKLSVSFYELEMMIVEAEYQPFLCDFIPPFIHRVRCSFPIVQRPFFINICGRDDQLL